MVWREDWILVRGEERKREGRVMRGKERRILVYLVNLLAEQFGLSATSLLTIAHSSACCLRSNTHSAVSR